MDTVKLQMLTHTQIIPIQSATSLHIQAGSKEFMQFRPVWFLISLYVYEVSDCLSKTYNPCTQSLSLPSSALSFSITPSLLTHPAAHIHDHLHSTTHTPFSGLTPFQSPFHFACLSLPYPNTCTFTITVCEGNDGLSPHSWYSKVSREGVWSPQLRGFQQALVHVVSQHSGRKLCHRPTRIWISPHNALTSPLIDSNCDFINISQQYALLLQSIMDGTADKLVLDFPWIL